MLHLLVLGVCVAAGLALLGYWLLNAEPAKLRRALKWTLILGGAGALIAMLARGNLHFLWSAALLALPLLLRWRALAQRFRNAAKTAAGPSPGQTSSVRAAFLEMTLDHDTGAMAGSVTQGRHAGRRLGDMGLEDLLDLLAECAGDPQSARLLESYIDRAHGEEWRSGGGGAAGGGAGAAAGAGPMTRAQALEILGLEEGAGEAEVRDAHRRLMLANHPDRGGSTFLAAQINRAKEVLLGAS